MITASVSIYQTKKRQKNIPTVMKTCFSEGKFSENNLEKNPFLRESPFSTDPLFLSNFLWPPLCPNFKNKNLPSNFRGRKLCEIWSPMATGIRKSGYILYPLYQFFLKIIIKKVHWQNLFNFLNAHTVPWDTCDRTPTRRHTHK